MLDLQPRRSNFRVHQRSWSLQKRIDCPADGHLGTIGAVSADPHDPPGGEIVGAVTPIVVALVKERRTLVDGEDQELLDLILIPTMDL